MVEAVRIGDAELWLGDCREIIPTLPDFDLILTDPPYGIGIAKKPVRQAHKKMDWDNAAPDGSVFDLMRSKAENLVIWGGNYFDLPPSQGFFVWDKKQPENFSLAMCEQAWCSFKKPAKMFRMSATSYRKQHPTQKPVELMEFCIKHAPACDTVLDPFMGSGTTGAACINTGKKFVGIEREREYFDMACERLEKLIFQPQPEGM